MLLVTMPKTAVKTKGNKEGEKQERNEGEGSKMYQAKRNSERDGKFIVHRNLQHKSPSPPERFPASKLRLGNVLARFR